MRGIGPIQFSNDPVYLASYRTSERNFWEGELWNKQQIKSLNSSILFELPGRELLLLGKLGYIKKFYIKVITALMI